MRIIPLVIEKEKMQQIQEIVQKTYFKNHALSNKNKQELLPQVQRFIKGELKITNLRQFIVEKLKNTG